MTPPQFPRRRRPAPAPGALLRRVLFLCSANYYWSRLGEELFNHHVRPFGLNWQAFSRALQPSPSNLNRGTMSPFVAEFLRVQGVQPLNHLRLPLEVTAFDFETCDLVFAVNDGEHRAALETRWPAFAGRVRYWDIGALDAVTPGVARARLHEHIATLIRGLTTAPGAEPL